MIKHLPRHRRSVLTLSSSTLAVSLPDPANRAECKEHHSLNHCPRHEPILYSRFTAKHKAWV